MLDALYRAERYRDLAHERRTLTAFSVSSKLKAAFRTWQIDTAR
jgi:hypothetical protein